MTAKRTDPEVASHVLHRVQLGAAWLDEVRPGWDREVDLERLEFPSMKKCVLGQLGLFVLAWRQDWDLHTYGFNLGDLKDDLNFDPLTDAWRRLIEERRS